MSQRFHVVSQSRLKKGSIMRPVRQEATFLQAVRTAMEAPSTERRFIWDNELRQYVDPHGSVSGHQVRLW